MWIATRSNSKWEAPSTFTYVKPQLGCPRGSFMTMVFYLKRGNSMTLPKYVSSEYVHFTERPHILYMRPSGAIRFETPEMTHLPSRARIPFRNATSRPDTLCEIMR